MKKRTFTYEEIKAMPATRQEARDANSDWYYTGVPCKNGHLTPRPTRTCHCLDCVALYGTNSNLSESARAHQRTLMRKWRREHPDYHLRYNASPENAWRVYLANFKWRNKDRLDHWTEKDFAYLKELHTEMQRLVKETGIKHRIAYSEKAKPGQPQVTLYSEKYRVIPTGSRA